MQAKVVHIVSLACVISIASCVVLVSCAGGGGGSPHVNPLWVTIEYPNPQYSPISNGASSTFQGMRGEAYCDNCPSPQWGNNERICQNPANNIPTGIGVSWKNNLTGDNGQAIHQIQPFCNCAYFFSTTPLFCELGYMHFWQIDSVPLGVGSNNIAINAYSQSGDAASASLDIVRSNSVLAIEPLDGATNVPINTTISVTFNANVNPLTVTSSSFMAKNSGGATVSGNYVVNGPTVTFTPSSYLATNTLYVVNTSSDIKDTNGIPMAVDRWVFTTSASLDVSPPTISSTNPANGATGIAVTNPIVATFSELIMGSSINTSTFTINNGVTGIVTLNSNIASFMPSTRLDFSTNYIATITMGVKDLAGNGMTTPYSWSFTTSAAPLPPTVLSTNPANNASGVSVTAPIYVTFSEPMDSATINSTTFSLNNGVAGTVTYNSGTYTAIFTPFGNLSSSTAYTATITSGVKETFGTPMATPYNWSFSTGLVTMTMKMPDSGQIVCYDISGSIIPCVGTGQDGEYAINLPSYSDNGDGTATDNITGLVWQKQNDGVTRSWNDANTYCNNLILGGVGGWRLPSRFELVTVSDYGNSVPTPATYMTYFPSGINSWSSTALPGQSWFYWAGGTANASPLSTTSTNYYSQCVRGAQSFQQLIDNGNGTVTDSRTNLTWQRNENSLMDWQTSINFCEALTLAGWNDWRMPNIKELASLVDDSKANPSINKAMFPGAISSNYWSSTTNPIPVYFTNSGRITYTWTVNFANGSSIGDYYSFNLKTLIGTNSVRCVRGG